MDHIYTHYRLIPEISKIYTVYIILILKHDIYGEYANFKVKNI